MKNYAEDFNSFLVNEKKSSKNTIESYMRDLNKFFAYCDINKVKTIENVTGDVVKKYEQFMLFNGQSEASVMRTIASLRCYFNYLLREKYISESPMLNIEKHRVVKKLPQILSNKEVIQLLNQPDGRDYKSCRDKAMLELLYATGIKVSELIEIKISDINVQIGILHMRGDDKKAERILPIYPQAIKAIKNYLNLVRDVVVINPNEDRLFTNMNGQPLTRQGFWKIVKYYAAAAKINKDITPHTLRHSFAAHLLENGAPLSDIQEMLGHSDISSTQVYAQLMKNKYAAAYKKYHPLAN